MAQTQSAPIPLGMSSPMNMTLPVLGLDVVQKLLLSFGLGPTHLSPPNPSLPHLSFYTFIPIPS